MFLAWNEIKNNKLRFILIIGVLTLVSYLVFLLSGLANGLENLNKEAIDKWEGDGIILTEESILPFHNPLWTSMPMTGMGQAIMLC